MAPVYLATLAVCSVLAVAALDTATQTASWMAFFCLSRLTM